MVHIEEQSVDSEPADAKAVLEELFVLLEDYSPAWYTEELHSRTQCALRRARRETTASNRCFSMTLPWLSQRAVRPLRLYRRSRVS